MRLMGLDVGDVRIGVSLSDPLKITAQGLESYTRVNLEEDIEHFLNLIKLHQVKSLVVGLPKNMNGTLGPQSEKVQAFINEILKKKEIEVIYVDERLTTVVAERTLISGDVSRKKRKKVVDKLAAVVILQTYLDRL